jgi:hypothetical protein
MPRALLRSSVVLILLVCSGQVFTGQALAQNADPAVATPKSPRSLTGKERLGRKWMDEQRIDNCKVPLDKRGAKPRPDTCASAPST